ncbi:MAG: subtilisin family serine protease, partial [Candidatus Krumholzibacteriia bacterium]
QIDQLTNAHYMRDGTPKDSAPAASPRSSHNKSLPWSQDTLLANPTNMNDEYISLAEYDVTGNLYAVFGAKDLGGTDRDIHIAQSTDGGQSWTVWEMPAFLEDEYHPEIAIDGAGYIHVTWVRADGYILRARTTNPDAPTQWAWVKGLAVGEPCATPSIAVSGGGDFAKVFIAAGFLTLNPNYGQYEWTLIFMSSGNGGSTVIYDYFLPDGYTDLWPDVAMSGGTVHFLNAEVDATTGETEILIASDVYTGSFSEPASFTGWTSYNTGFPQIAASENFVYVVYQHDFSNGVSVDGDIIYTSSNDFGASWFGPYGMVADEFDSVGPTVFTRGGTVGCLWLDAPAGADEYELGSRLASGFGDISFFGGVEIVTEQPRVEPTFHSAFGVVTNDKIHAAWIDRRDFATQGHNVYTSVHELAPNLRPFTPAEWDSSLVANMIFGEREEGWVAAGDTAFVSFAFLSDGLQDVTNTFYVDLEIDGEIEASWELVGGLDAGVFVPLEDYPVVLSSGMHTISLIIDPTDAVAEMDEGDNIVSRTYHWLNGDADLRFHPTALVTVITPETSQTQAWELAKNPITKREFSLQTVSPELANAMTIAKSTELLPVIIVPTERLDAVAMGLALQGATRATRREVILAGARTQAQNSYDRLAPVLSQFSGTGMASEARSLWLPGMIAVSLGSAAINQLADNPEVGRIWLDDQKSETFGQPTTTGAALAGSVAWHLTDIGAEQAWAEGKTGEGIIIGHLDSGVSYDHPDLVNQMWDGGTEFPNHGWDAVDDDNDPYDGDSNWNHGTHTGGLIVGDGSNGTKTGVAPGAKLMALRTIPGYFVDIIEALQFGLDNGVHIFSMSAGWTSPPDDVRVANRYNAELMLSIDVPWVCAAGNGDNTGGHFAVPNDIASPGDCPGPFYAPNGGQTSIITVGASDISHGIGATSSYGPTEWNTTNVSGETDYHDYPYSPGLMKPDLTAPGVNITSTNGLDSYVAYDGTSMSCPLVTGAMVLALSETPSLTPAQLAEMFEATAIDLTQAPASSGRDNYSGAGLINIPAALNQSPSASPLRIKITNYGNLPLIFGDTFAPANWLHLVAPTGHLKPGASRFVDVTIDPTALSEGTYEATVIFLTNDPNPASVLPVTLIYGNHVTAVDDEIPAPRPDNLKNYPNPFNPRTVLRFEMGKTGPVKLAIHDMRGRLVRHLVAAELNAGTHEWVWDGNDDQGGAVASGQYFARLQIKGTPDVSRKLMLVR